MRAATALAVLAAWSCGWSAAPGCAPGAQPVCCVCDSSAGPLRVPGACQRIGEWLAGALPAIGYCLQSGQTAEDTAGARPHELRLATHAGPADTVVVTLLRAADTAAALPGGPAGRRLTELPHAGEEQAAFEAVLASKIVENLRESYVCHFAVDAKPESVTVRTSTGLEGMAPVEWIVPLGKVTVTARKPRHLPETHDVELARPGYHRYHVELRRRRFYHSRLMIPAAALALASGVCYALDRHYYADYRSLGESDYYRNPQSFEQTYTRAVAWERASQISLILAGLCLALSLRF